MKATICLFLLNSLLGSTAICQDATSAIATLDKTLASKSKTVSQVLTDTGLMYLHSLHPLGK